MFHFKVGDRFAYVGPPVHPKEKCQVGVLTLIDAQGVMYGRLDSDTDDYIANGGYRYYGMPEDEYIIPEELYLSPLWEALQ